MFIVRKSSNHHFSVLSAATQRRWVPARVLRCWTVVELGGWQRAWLLLVLATHPSKARARRQLSDLRMLTEALQLHRNHLTNPSLVNWEERKLPEGLQQWTSGHCPHWYFYNISLIFKNHDSTLLFQWWICYMWLMDLQQRKPTRRDLLLGTLSMLTNTWNVIISESDNLMKFKWQDAVRLIRPDGDPSATKQSLVLAKEYLR